MSTPIQIEGAEPLNDFQPNQALVAALEGRRPAVQRMTCALVQAYTETQREQRLGSGAKSN